jgi:cold shock CspA family protein/arsenate reductase-like glutaredoxin family protein
MSNGTVKFFNVAKGFGFITPESGGKDIFVPSGSLTASGISSLKPGQRISFEEVPDSKGPKAVDLKLLADAPKPKADKEQQPVFSSNTAIRPQLTFYHDHTSDWSCHVLDRINDAGHEMHVIEYLRTPPAKDELRALSRLLGNGDQSLVRRYEPLFLELRLDDRFIGDSEFWDAIFENPALINGPVLATDVRASLCHSEEAVDAFFSAPSQKRDQPMAKPKGLSERALRILAGETMLPIARLEVVESADDAPAKKALGVTRLVPVLIAADVCVEKEAKAKAKDSAKAGLKAKPTKAAAKPGPIAKAVPKAKAPAKPAKLLKKKGRKTSK